MFDPESSAGIHWRSTVLLNHRFAARVFFILFGFGCIGQSLFLLTVGRKESVDPILFGLPLVVALMAYWEWRESRQLRKHHESPSLDKIDPNPGIWLVAVMEALGPVAGFALIGLSIGWPAGLGGPPLVATVLIPLVSILRLDYRICILQGVLGALGYWSMVWLAFNQNPSDHAVISSETIPQVGIGIILIGTGVLTGAIANQNRRRILDVIHEQQERKQVQGKLRTRTADYERAEEIILEKNEFISILSHDMRAPLDGVASLAQLMARAPEKFTLADVRKYAEEIRNTAHNLRELLDNLVVWAELKSGQISPPAEPILLTDLVTPVTQIMEPAITARRLILESDIPSDEVVFGNTAAIGTVIRNLVSNAVKYSPQLGRIKLSVIISKNGKNVALVVTDDGPGLPQSQLQLGADPKADAPASESSPAPVRKELGLALCRQLLRQLDGSLELRNAESGGTEARMWLPRS